MAQRGPYSKDLTWGAAHLILDDPRRVRVCANRVQDPIAPLQVLELLIFAIVAAVILYQLYAVLLIECPRYLFPYARRIVSEMTSEGGFPPFLIEPLDFRAIYAQRKGAALQQQAVGQA